MSRLSWLRLMVLRKTSLRELTQVVRVSTTLLWETLMNVWLISELLARMFELIWLAHWLAFKVTCSHCCALVSLLHRKVSLVAELWSSMLSVELSFLAALMLDVRIVVLRKPWLRLKLTTMLMALIRVTLFYKWFFIVLLITVFTIVFTMTVTVAIA